jgi:hypothetical protein
MRQFRHLRVVLLICAAVAISAVFGGCRSNEPKPGDWAEYQFPDVDYREVDQLVRAVLTQKFGYRIIKYKVNHERNLITYETEWNARGTTHAVFSGEGVRRRAFVEVQGIHRDDDLMAKLEDDRRSRPVDRTNDPSVSREPVYEVVNGRRMRVIAEVGLSVIRQRNESILNPSSPSRGEWRGGGEDDEERIRIESEIRDRVRDLTGRPFGPSERALEAHRRYFEGTETPENWRSRREREPE